MLNESSSNEDDEGNDNIMNDQIDTIDG